MVIANCIRCYRYNSISATVVSCDGICAIISYTGKMIYTIRHEYFKYIIIFFLDSDNLAGGCVTEEYCTLLNMAEKGLGDKRINSNMRCHPCETNLCNNGITIMYASSVKHVAIVFSLVAFIVIFAYI